MPAESKLEQLEQFLHIDVHARARDTVHKGEPFQLFHMPLPALLAKSRRNASATPGETGETRPRLGATGTGGGGSKRPGGALSDRSLPLVSQRPPSRTFFLEHECLPNLLLTA